MTAIYNTIRTVVAAVVPIISDFIDALTPIYEAIVDVFSSIIDACEPLFGMFGEGAGIFETLLGVVVNMVLAPLRALAFVLSIVTPVIRFFATAISEIAAFISGVLRPVFDAMAAMMHDLNVGFRRLINGLIDCVNMLIDFYNTLPIPGRLQRMSRIAEAPAAPAPNAAPNQQQQQQGNRPPNFQGEVRQQMQLVGIAEAWRRAQTADPNDPSLRLQQQQLNQAQESNGVLNDILNWLRSNGGNQAVFGS
jgi:hypothetical protein